MTQKVEFSEHDIDRDAKRSYKHIAVHKETGQRIGSDDGTTWFDTRTGEQYHGE